MAYPHTPLNLGTAADDGTGDTLRDGGAKLNADLAAIKVGLDNWIAALGIDETGVEIGTAAEFPITGTTGTAARSLFIENERLQKLSVSYAAGLAAGDPITGDTLEVGISKLQAKLDLVSGPFKYIGTWDASGSALPTGITVPPGTGPGGAIAVGNAYALINAPVGGFVVDGVNYAEGDLVAANVDAPDGTTSADYYLFKATVSLSNAAPVPADNNIGSPGVSTQAARGDRQDVLQTRLGGSEVTLTHVADHALTDAEIIKKRHALEYTANGVFSMPLLASAAKGDELQFNNDSAFAVALTPKPGENFAGWAADRVYQLGAGEAVDVVLSVNGWRAEQKGTTNVTKGGRIVIRGVTGTGTGDYDIASFVAPHTGTYDADFSMCGVPSGGVRITLVGQVNSAASGGGTLLSIASNIDVVSTGSESRTLPTVSGEVDLVKDQTYYFHVETNTGSANSQNTQQLTLTPRMHTVSAGSLVAEKGVVELVDGGPTSRTNAFSYDMGYTPEQIAEEFDLIVMSARDRGWDNKVVSVTVPATALLDGPGGEVRLSDLTSGTARYIMWADFGAGSTTMQLEQDTSSGSRSFSHFRMLGIRKQFNATPADAQPLPTDFVNLGNWQGVNLNNVITNGMLVGLGTGAAGTGNPSPAFTGSCKITAIGSWIQQDFLSSNPVGTVTGERFSRQSFDGGVTWSAWFGQ